MQPYAKPVPLPDPDSSAYWQALAAHELRVQRCTDCGTYRWPSREICHRCRGTRSEMARMSGSGEVVSWTFVHHATVSGFEDELPYCIGLVRLAESPEVVLVGSIDASSSRLRPGLPVQASYADVAPGVTLLRWVESHH